MEDYRPMRPLETFNSSIFLDLKKAFIDVDHAMLIRKLRKVWLCL